MERADWAIASRVCSAASRTSRGTSSAVAAVATSDGPPRIPVGRPPVRRPRALRPLRPARTPCPSAPALGLCRQRRRSRCSRTRRWPSTRRWPPPHSWRRPLAEASAVAPAVLRTRRAGPSASAAAARWTRLSGRWQARHARSSARRRGARAEVVGGSPRQASGSSWSRPWWVLPSCSGACWVARHPRPPRGPRSDPRHPARRTHA